MKRNIANISRDLEEASSKRRVQAQDQSLTAFQNREFLVLNRKKVFIGDTIIGCISNQYVEVCIKSINKRSVRGIIPNKSEITLKFSDIQMNSEECQQDSPKLVMAQRSKALLSVQSLQGLKDVKIFFQDTYDSMMITKLQGMGFGNFNLNLQLVGNPGLEIAKVASAYVALLKEMGIVSDTADVKEYSGASLTKEYRSALQIPTNGVVIITDMIDLSDSNAGMKVLDEIAVNSDQSSTTARNKLVWILTGTAKNMEKCMSHNAALHTNFPTKVLCDDLSDRELEGLFRGYMERGGRDATGWQNASSVLSRPIVLYTFLTYQNKFHEICVIDVAVTETFGTVGVYAPSEVTVKTKKFATNQMATSFFNFLKLERTNNEGWTVRDLDSNSDKSDTIDSWGNIWKWHMTAKKWLDPHGSWSTLPTLNNIGTRENPIVTTQPDSTVCTAWAYDDTQHCFYNVGSRFFTKWHYPALDLKQQFRIAHSDVKYLRIALNRLGRGKEGFGNANSVKKLFFTVLKRQADRLAKEKVDFPAVQPGEHPALTNDVPFSPLFLLTKADLLGHSREIESVFESSAAWKELLSMEGLQEVKASLRQLMELCVDNAKREERGLPLLQVALNRIFLGNPGTGKTTVAKLYARILADLGLLSKGEVIYKTPSDFKGRYVGHSEAQTKAILDSAMGNVLVIDVAYGLLPVKDGVVAGDRYGEAIITTIVEQVMGAPGEDRAVVMLGYREEMQQMLTHANPGLARRFQMDNALVFSDFDDGALQRILQAAVQKDQLVMSEETAVHAIKQLARAKALPHFGNAGAVNNLYSDAKLRFQTRQRALPELERSDELLAEDFTRPLATQTEDELFAELVGGDAVREKLRQIERNIAFAKRLGRSDPKSMCEFNYVFTGNPGTGKTTVARLMGKMFCKLGLIPCEDVVEVSACDLITGYVGQAGKKTRDVLTKARGKVLFIDEAYQLNPKHGGHYMQEVVDEMVKSLTSEEFKGKLVVILAGYEQSVKKMLRANPGLKSRFPTKIHFVDFTPETVHAVLLGKIASENMRLDAGAATDLEIVSESLVRVPGFANGRDVQTYFRHVYSAVACRYSSSYNPKGDCDGGDGNSDSIGGDIGGSDLMNTVVVTSPDLYYAFNTFVRNK